MIAQVSIYITALVAMIAPLINATPISPPSPNTSPPLTNGSSHNGRGTVYDQEGATGSCGQTNSDNAMIAALSSSNGNSCGRQIRIRNSGSNDGVAGLGQTAIVTVEDTCAGCGPEDVDLSHAAWRELTNGAQPGTFEAAWEFV